MNPFGDVQFERKPNGYIIIDGQEVAHTLQCCHCGIHFVSIRGSGKIRGKCFACNGITCGKQECDVCVPFEAKLEYEETGKIFTRFLTNTIQLLDKYGKVL